MTVLGIDPGRTGGAVILDGRRCVVALQLADLGPWSAGAAALLAAWLAPHVDDLELCGIESPSIRPGESGRSALTIGTGYGLLLGVVASFGVRVEVMTPPTWRRALRLPARGKDRKAAKADAIAWAAQVPGLDLTPGRCTTPQSGLADAACIAAAAMTLRDTP